MIVVRDIFHIKFGKAREVTDLFKEGIAIFKKVGFGALNIRLLTDLVGEPYYTTILETMYESVASWEQSSQAVRGSEEWRVWYQKLIPLIDNGERKIYSVVS